jgi:uroporphyrinogen-III synthase
MRVIAFESRRAKEIAVLIEKNGGEAFVAPSVREVPLEDNTQAFDFAERLFRGEFDMMILLTGVGVKALDKVLATRYGETEFRAALRKLTVAARGPKPAAAMREWSVPVAVIAPEPNTSRELLAALEGRPERRIALQEYGKSNPELIAGLEARGATVTPVQVYLWDLPEDTAPLEEAARRIAAGEAEIIIFTTQIQLQHLLRIADKAGVSSSVLENMKRMVVASIGPTTSEALEEAGVQVDFAPSHPKMGILVQELAGQAPTLLLRRRGA